MSTRSIIVIHGNNKPYSDTVSRLYKHSDGYPTDTLDVIASALERANELLDADAKRWKEKTRKDPSCSMLTGLIVGEGTTVYGMGVGLEKTYGVKFEPKHLGDQFDLEWIYVIDLNAKTVGVYGGGFTGDVPQAAFKQGPVDPLIEIAQTSDEYQNSTRKEILELTARIAAAGFKVLPVADEPKPKAKRARKPKIELVGVSK